MTTNGLPEFRREVVVVVSVLSHRGRRHDDDGFVYMAGSSSVPVFGISEPR